MQRLVACILQLLKTNLRWRKWECNGNNINKNKLEVSKFRIPIIWFSEYSRLNPNFIINNYYFAELDGFTVVHPVWSSLWSLRNHLNIWKKIMKCCISADAIIWFLVGLRWIAINKVSDSSVHHAEALNAMIFPISAQVPLAVAYPLGSRFWSLCDHLSVCKDLKYFLEAPKGLR